MLNKSTLIKVPKFYAVGLIAFAFEASILFLNSIYFAWDPVLVRLFSLPIASTITWKLNRSFTFKSTNPRKFSQYGSVLANNVISQSANYLIYVFLLSKLPTTLLPTEIIALFLAAVATSFYNFVVGNFIIFRR